MKEYYRHQFRKEVQGDQAVLIEGHCNQGYVEYTVRTLPSSDEIDPKTMQLGPSITIERIYRGISEQTAQKIPTLIRGLHSGIIQDLETIDSMLLDPSPQE